VILRWSAGALADLESMLASFEARLTAIERRIVEFPSSAPEVEQRPGVRVVAFRDFPYRLFYRAAAEAIDLRAVRRPPFE
jgi:hypothetical protein